MLEIGWSLDQCQAVKSIPGGCRSMSKDLEQHGDSESQWCCDSRRMGEVGSL